MGPDPPSKFKPNPETPRQKMKEIVKTPSADLSGSFPVYAGSEIIF
jgi:hypothetical protein